jgi:hypothetical protein
MLGVDHATGVSFVQQQALLQAENYLESKKAFQK